MDFVTQSRDETKPVACVFALKSKQPFGHCAWPLNAIEYMIDTSKSACSVERTLLPTGMLDQAMHGLASENRAFATPELHIGCHPADWPSAEMPVGVPLDRI